MPRRRGDIGEGSQKAQVRRRVSQAAACYRCRSLHTHPAQHTHTHTSTRSGSTEAMSHPMSSVALRPINTHHPRPQRIFLRRRSVSTCYPLSAPCPSVSQRHPNAPSSPYKKKKCDFGEEKLRGFVLQLFSVGASSKSNSFMFHLLQI